ncbi:helix-turn-helix domain-containing protein [Acidiferrobacter thiooxydans]|nr:helix-turn-helix transcriptional regulator [Acidiferrobacter thiooxydans]
MAKIDDQKSLSDSLGAHLMRLRTAAGMSLRQVEDATKKEISNAYLSQLENNKIARPSPNVLHALANVYKTSYEDLMKRAGYLSSDTEASGQKKGKVATFAVQGLTPEEENALLEYLAFIRKQRRK